MPPAGRGPPVPPEVLHAKSLNHLRAVFGWLIPDRRWQGPLLAGLYLQRWGVELHFRELKTLMRRDVLRCRSPQMIRKELRMHFIAYNVVRAVMLQAALPYQVELSRFSFKGTLGALQAFAAVLQGGGLSVRPTGRPGKRTAALGGHRSGASAA